MPSSAGDNMPAEKILSSGVTRLSRRAVFETARSSPIGSSSKDPSPVEPPKKRSRNVPENSASSPRKSVTVTVKPHDTEEFHSPSAAAIIHSANSTSSSASKNSQTASQSLPPDASTSEKVIAVVNFLRDRRRRPEEKAVIHHCERMYHLTPTETKSTLQTLVDEGRIIRVKYSSGISYRYHMSVVARGDTVPQQPSKIRAKYTVSMNRTNGASRAPTNRTSTPVKADTFSGVDMYRLKSFARLVRPNGCFVQPSALTSNEDYQMVEKITKLLPEEALGDASQFRPGVSIYGPTLPTPLTLETVEKALRGLPHMKSTSDPGDRSKSRQNGRSSSKSEGEAATSSQAIFSRLSTKHLSDPSMSIVFRRHPVEGFIEIRMRSPGSSLRNAFTVQVLDELTEILQITESDAQIRAVLISGHGTVFSSGIDLPSITSPKCTGSFIDNLIAALRKFLLQIASYPKILVAGVNGPAEGLGTAMLPLFDLVYASDTATFHMAYTTLGQVPEAGASISLAQRVGVSLANELLLAGRRLTAREALQRGLVSDLLFPKNYEQEVILRCARMSIQSAMALESIKCFSRLCGDDNVKVMIDAECQKLSDIWKTPEFQVSASLYVRHCMDDFL